MNGATAMSAGTLSPFALLWPTFAMVGVILVVWFVLLAQRMRHLRAHPPTREDFASGDAARRYFQPVEMPANNLANLFEMPVLFFALVPLELMFRQVTVAQVLLAWFFVTLRAIHSYVHVARKDVRLRFQIYLASVAVLVAMWVGFFVDALALSRLWAIHARAFAQL